MIWFKILTSSVGKKFIMSLMGLFLIIFLATHLSINLLLVFSNSTDAFNQAAHLLGANIIFRLIEIVLFLIFLVHIATGIVLQIQNWLARPVGYKVSNTSQQSFFSKWLFHTAVVIFIFLAIHLADFFYKIKFSGEVGTVLINGKEYHDTAALVINKFHLTKFVILYLLAFIVLSFHYYLLNF